MSEWRIQILDLAATADTAADRATAVRSWLRLRGWTTPADPAPRDWIYGDHPGDLPGPRMITASGRSYLTPVCVIAGWRMYLVGATSTGPRCQRCGADANGERRDEFDPDAAYSPGVEDEWLETGLATVTSCPACGWRASLTDWELSTTATPSHLALTLDAEDRADELTAELAADFPGRWIRVGLHL